MSIIAKKTSETPDIIPMYTAPLQEVKLACGLGNFGDKYQHNRHNVGFMCLDFLAQHYQKRWQVKRELKSQLTQINLGGTNLILVKPLTYMNLSGEALVAVQRFYKLTFRDIFIIHDEIRLPFGTIEALMTEDNFGHNGLRSIQEHCTEELQLFRVGIGPKTPPQIDLSDFVLSDFNSKQLTYLNKITKETGSLLSEISQDNFRNEKRQVVIT